MRSFIVSLIAIAILFCWSAAVRADDEKPSGKPAVKAKPAEKEKAVRDDDDDEKGEKKEAKEDDDDKKPAKAKGKEDDDDEKGGKKEAKEDDDEKPAKAKGKDDDDEKDEKKVATIIAVKKPVKAPTKEATSVPVKKPVKTPVKDVLVKLPTGGEPSVAELAKLVQKLSAEVDALRRELRERK